MLIGRNSTGWLLKRNYRLLRLELPHVATKKYSVSCHLYFHSSGKAHAGPANFWTAQSSSAAGNLALKTIENPPSNEVFKAWMLTAAQSLGRTATAHSSGGPPGSQATSCDQPWRSRLQHPMACHPTVPIGGQELGWILQFQTRLKFSMDWFKRKSTGNPGSYPQI